MTHDLRAHVGANRRPSKQTEPHIKMPSNEHMHVAELAADKFASWE